MPQIQHSTDPLDSVWRALSDPTRRGLMDQLRGGPMTTTQLVESFSDMTRFGVMKHMGILEEARPVVSEKEGRTRWYYLNPPPPPCGRCTSVESANIKTSGRDRSPNSKHILNNNTTIKENDMSAKLMEQSARLAEAKIEIVINAPHESVYNAWFKDTSAWFYHSEETKATHPTHCEHRMGGKFYTALPDDCFNVLGELTMIKPNEKICIKGDCTMPSAVIMNITLAFEDVEGGTKVSIDHRMAGEIHDGMAEEFEEGWLDGLTKLKAVVES